MPVLDNPAASPVIPALDIEQARAASGCTHPLDWGLREDGALLFVHKGPRLHCHVVVHPDELANAHPDMTRNVARMLHRLDMDDAKCLVGVPYAATYHAPF